MLQHYDNYSPEEQRLWNFLFKRQYNLLAERACKDFFIGLELLKDVINPLEIPKIPKVSLALFELNGWSIEIVDKLLPMEEFFFFLSKKKWPSYASIRQKGNLNFSHVPDIFHDIFGHVPLLTNLHYANFMQKIGAAGLESSNDPLILRQLQRLFCFTIDYGFIEQDGKSKMYGAGILSSFRETHCAINKRYKIQPYNFSRLIYSDFTIDLLQKFYVRISSFEQLTLILNEYRSFMMDPSFVKIDPGLDFTKWL